MSESEGGMEDTTDQNDAPDGSPQEVLEDITEEEVLEISCTQGTKREADKTDVKDLEEDAKKMKLQSKHRVQRIRKANSRYWLQLNKWISQTSPHEPSLAILYLMRTRGRVQVVWEGPDHMKEFATDKKVVECFRGVSLKRSSLPYTMKVSKVLSKAKLRVHSKDVSSYRSDQLSKLIAEILNPGCKRNFYREENKPRWFPQHIPFRAPNHKTKDGQPKLNVGQNREILRAFFSHCPEEFIVEGEEDEESSEESIDGGDEEESESDEDDSDKPFKKELVIPPMGCAQALNLLNDSKDWPMFVTIVSRVRLAVNLTCLDGLKHQSLDDISESFLDTNTPVPDDAFQPLVSTGDGNCFYNTISILLSGSEGLATELRLASVLHAAEHFDHYHAMLEREIPEVDMAVQFLYTVVGSCQDVDGRPKNNPSATEVHRYTLQTLIRDSSRIGRDAGFLQLLFLSGATGHPIQQHCSLTGHHALYRTLVPPCSCAENYHSVVHIMWTNFAMGPGDIPNHIIPLLQKTPPAGDSSNATTSVVTVSSEDLEQTCLMWGECTTSLAVQGKRVDWVICKTCQAWYHSVCVGLSPKLTMLEDFAFSCCTLPSPENNMIVVKHPLTIKRGDVQSQLTISDVQSIYPWNGVSDAVIDFYIREMLPANPDVAVVGALTYTAVVKHSSPGSSDRLVKAHQDVNGRLSLLGKNILIFPCRTSGVWHWILIAVMPSSKKALIMDSMSNVLTPYSNFTVKGVGKLLLALDVIKDDILTPVSVKVCQQNNSTDCGIHVLRNMAQLVLHSVEGIKNLESPFSSMAMRRDILRKSHDLTGKCVRRIYSQCKVEAYKQGILSRSDEHGLKEVFTEDKGRGVVAEQTFQMGDFLCRYNGELITMPEAQKRRRTYKEELGSYLFFFKHGGKDLCIDATEEDTSLGRLINHSKSHPNVVVKVVADTRPYLCIFAARNIESGEELLYDYGERSKAATENFAWLKR